MTKNDRQWVGNSDLTGKFCFVVPSFFKLSNNLKNDYWLLTVTKGRETMSFSFKLTEVKLVSHTLGLELLKVVVKVAYFFGSFNRCSWTQLTLRSLTGNETYFVVSEPNEDILFSEMIKEFTSLIILVISKKVDVFWNQFLVLQILHTRSVFQAYRLSIFQLYYSKEVINSQRYLFVSLSVQHFNELYCCAIENWWLWKLRYRVIGGQWYSGRPKKGSVWKPRNCNSW